LGFRHRLTNERIIPATQVSIGTTINENVADSITKTPWHYAMPLNDTVKKPDFEFTSSADPSLSRQSDARFVGGLCF